MFNAQITRLAIILPLFVLLPVVVVIEGVVVVMVESTTTVAEGGGMEVESTERDGVQVLTLLSLKIVHNLTIP